MGAPTPRKATKKAAAKKAAPRKRNAAQSLHKHNGAWLDGPPGPAETPPPALDPLAALGLRVESLSRQVETLRHLVAKMLAVQAGPQLQAQLADQIAASLSQGATTPPG